MRLASFALYMSAVFALSAAVHDPTKIKDEFVESTKTEIDGPQDEKIAEFMPTPDAAPDTKFFIFREDCFDKFFVHHDFTDKKCLKFTISKALGYGIVAGAALVKVPQIIKILSAKSAEGISLFSMYSELMCNILITMYNVLQVNAFSTYGETVFISIQNTLIVLLMWTFMKTSMIHKLLVAVFFAGISVGPFYMPGEYLPLMYNATVPIFLWARLLQIIQNFKQGGTGNLAFLTLFMNFAGTLARIFTTLQEVKDTRILINFILNTALNGILVFQVLYYWGSKSSPEQERAQKKKTQ